MPAAGGCCLLFSCTGGASASLTSALAVQHCGHTTSLVVGSPHQQNLHGTRPSLTAGAPALLLIQVLQMAWLRQDAPDTAIRNDTLASLRTFVELSHIKRLLRGILARNLQVGGWGAAGAAGTWLLPGC